MIIRRLQPCETREMHEWIKLHHRMQSAPPGHIAAFEFLEGKERVGGLLMGRPNSKGYDADLITEFTRVCFLDLPANSASRALAMARKQVRIHWPQFRLLLSYHNPAEHDGTMYLADGWCPLGMTKAKHGQNGWASRQGRKYEEVYSPKQRWVRTP